MDNLPAHKVSGARAAMLRKALDAKADVIVFIDHDVSWAPEDLVKLIKTGDPAAAVDPEAPANAVIASLGIERDGFRGNWLAVSAKMGTEGGDEEDDMAGV